MAQAEYINDHYEIATDRLPTQFVDKPNIDALVKTWTEMLQEVESDLWDIDHKTRFLEVEGGNIERYGSLYGIKREFHESDFSYWSKIIGEILARSSDGTVDNIRIIGEAITGTWGTNILEHTNPVNWQINNVPFLTGAVFLYGFYSDGGVPLRFTGQEASLLRKGCPITTGSVVYGVHTVTFEDENNLFIPCEIEEEDDALHVRKTPNNSSEPLVTSLGVPYVTTLDNVSRYGKDWELAILPEIGLSRQSFRVDPDQERLMLQKKGSTGVEEFVVEFDGIDNTHGVFLEISTDYLEE